MIVTIGYVRHYLCQRCGYEWAMRAVLELDGVPFKCGRCGREGAFLVQLATRLSGERTWVMMPSGLRTTVGG